MGSGYTGGAGGTAVLHGGLSWAPTEERLSGSEVVIHHLPSGRPWGPCHCFLPHARHLRKYKDQVPGRSQPQMLLGIKLLKL